MCTLPAGKGLIHVGVCDVHMHVLDYWLTCFCLSTVVHDSLMISGWFTQGEDDVTECVHTADSKRVNTCRSV